MVIKLDKIKNLEPLKTYTPLQISIPRSRYSLHHFSIPEYTVWSNTYYPSSNCLIQYLSNYLFLIYCTWLVQVLNKWTIFRNKYFMVDTNKTMSRLPAMKLFTFKRKLTTLLYNICLFHESFYIYRIIHNPLLLIKY